MAEIGAFRTAATIVANFIAVLLGVVIGLYHDRQLENDRRQQEAEKEREELEAIIDQLREELANLQSTASEVQDAIDEDEEQQLSSIWLSNSTWEAHRDQFIRLWKLDNVAGEYRTSGTSLPIQLTELYSLVGKVNRILETIIDSGYTGLPMQSSDSPDEIETARINRYHTEISKISGEIEKESDTILELLPEIDE